MVVVARFKRAFGNTHVRLLFLVISFYRCLINNSLGLALPGQWAGVSVVQLLSKYTWILKDSKIDFAVSWKIIKRCTRYSSHTKKCNICLHENDIIICHPKLSSLNSRNELVSTLGIEGNIYSAAILMILMICNFSFPLTSRTGCKCQIS